MKNWLRSQVRAFHAVLLWHWARHKCSSSPLLVTPAKTLVFAPHPDDETFGCGGFIALKTQRNALVGVVFLTDGQHCYGDLGPPADEVIALRRGEARAALDILGVPPAQTFFLNNEDGTLHALADNAREKFVADLSALIAHFAPEEILLPHQNDRHTDHEAAFELIQEALERAALPAPPRQIHYVIWRFWEASLFDRETWKNCGGAKRLPLKNAAQTKCRALLAYPSQIALLPALFVWQHRTFGELFYPTEEKSDRPQRARSLPQHVERKGDHTP